MFTFLNAHCTLECGDHISAFNWTTLPIITHVDPGTLGLNGLANRAKNALFAECWPLELLT